METTLIDMVEALKKTGYIEYAKKKLL